MLQANETVYLNERSGKNGKYYSGFMLTSKVRQLCDLADQAGFEAIGISDFKDIKIKTGKNAGQSAKVQTWTPFKMKAKTP